MAEKKEPINLADVKAQMEAMKAEMIAEAKAEAEKILAEANASAGGKKTAEQIEADEKEKAYLNEEVEIELFKDSGRYKDDVFVAVNGVGINVPRGKKVMVKRKYALVIENSLKQDRKADDFIELKVRELEKAEARL